MRCAGSSTAGGHGRGRGRRGARALGKEATRSSVSSGSRPSAWPSAARCNGSRGSQSTGSPLMAPAVVEEGEGREKREEGDTPVYDRWVPG